MKLKIPVRHYSITADILDKVKILNKDRGQINYTIAAFSEFRTLLLNVVVKNYDVDLDKKVSKHIPDSYGLLFFQAFCGVQLDGYENVVVKEICRQVEKQLFKSGMYQLEN